MKERDESFSPETVDEQIDHLLQAPLSPEQASNSSVQMVHLLQDVYEEDPRIQRVWERLADHLPMTHSSGESQENQPLAGERFSQTSSSTIVKFPQVKGVGMKTQTRLTLRSHKWGAFQRSLELLVAVLIISLLVGSLVTVLHLSHQKLSRQIGASQQGSRHGQIVYSTPEENGWVAGLAWSFNSQRVATAIGNNAGGQIEIWDSTTGKHKVAVPLNLDPIANPAWSPTSNLLAVPTSDAVVIVNGSTGKFGASYPAPSRVGLSTIATTATTGKTFLSTFVPLGGAPNFGGISWSPDGKWIVSTFSSSTSDGVVQVWNPRTGKLAFTLATKPDYFMGDVSWSPDGQYIAVKMAKWDETFQIVVWKAQTRQIVFQQFGNFEGLSWQPGTDNLATATILPGSNSSLPGTPTYGNSILNIWNVKTGQLLKTFASVDGISWSPDGHEFVYTNFVGAPSAKASVTVLNVNTGQTVYMYQVSGTAAQVIRMDAVWSPNGRYILSDESIESSPYGRQSYRLKVWVA
jgi:WD40 repeat protein